MKRRSGLGKGKWKIGLVIPLRKKKGSRKDKNTYRGITLLSVGSKLLARVVATRLRSWSEGFIHESQCGFRKGRGVDDNLEMSQRIAEEVVKTASEDWVLLTFFDIEKEKRHSHEYARMPCGS